MQRSAALSCSVLQSGLDVSRQGPCSLCHSCQMNGPLSVVDSVIAKPCGICFYYDVIAQFRGYRSSIESRY